jgi:asparagine synthase (glutamine-hydrolysing)
LDWLERFVPHDVPAVTAAQMLDLRLFLVDHILCKVDRAAMAHGVEARVPFLDQDLVRSALAVPLAWHYRGNRRKALLREIAQRHLPASMVTGRKKGFSSPVAGWFDAKAREWADGLLDDGALVHLDLLRPEWSAGITALARQSPRLALRPRWLLLSAELWARRWLLPDLWPSGIHHG